MKRRRILAWALSLSMVVSSFSYQVFAQEDVVQEADSVLTEAVDASGTAEESENAVSDEDKSENAQTDAAIETGIEDAQASADDLATSAAVDANAALDPSELMALEGWSGGSTSSLVTTTQVIEPGSDSVRLAVTGGKGKLSDTEDSIVYYATEIDNDLDFTLSAKITVNDVNESSVSNPRQSGYGIAVLNRLYDKATAGDPVFTSGAFGTFAMETNSAAIGKFGLRTRTTPAGGGNEGATTTPAADIVALANTGVSGKGDSPLDVSLNKTGNVVTLTVNGNSESYTFSDTDLNGKVYPMFFVARSADITVSDIVYKHDSQRVASLKVKTPPTKTNYIVNQELDLTGLEVEATYEDGSTAVVDDYKVTGFDKTSASTQTLTVTKGKATTTFDVVVSPLDVTELKINVVPYDTVYHSGIPFSAKGLDVTAVFNDGSTQTFKNGDNTIVTINGIELKEGELVDSGILALNSDVDARVTLAKSDNYTVSDDVYATYKAAVSNASLEALSVAYMPQKVVFYIGDEFTYEGLSVMAVYSDGYHEVISDDKYELSGFDSETTGTKTITVTSTIVPSITTSYEVKVNERRGERLKISKYPKTTYDVGEAWNAAGMEIVIVYNSADEIAAVLGTDYTIDTSKFNTSETGITYVYIVPTSSEYETLELPITVRDSSAAHWRSLVFGQSSTGVNAGDPSSDITQNSDGSVTVKSWHGSGKITGDHDGIAYYYTRVNPADNFSLSADIYIRGYLGTHPGTGAVGYYNVDEKRSGQESFGIMARDVIPLDAKDGLGNDNDITVYSSDAETDSDGEPIGKRSSAVFASNIAIAGGYSGSAWPADPTAASYYKNANINRINLYARTGVDAIDGGGVKNGPNAISKAFPNAGIYSQSTSSVANGTPEDETRVGDTYRITLERVNVQSDYATGAITRRGLKATAEYKGPDESRIGETMTTYMSDEVMNNIFSIQNPNDAYVGFFAARWGIIDVSNIEFSVSDPATDPVYDVVQEEAVTPYVSVASSLYTSDTNYTLILRANNNNGGFLTIKKGEKTLYHQLQIGKKRVRVPLVVDADSANTYTFIYTPSKLDYLTSYDDVVSTVTIYHRSYSELDTIYVAPNGQSEAYEDANGVVHSAGSSKEYPMDLITAIGFIQNGQKIVMLDGTYQFDQAINISLANNGAKGKVKTIEAEEGAKPVIDFMGKGAGFYVGGNYWHIKDLEIINSADNQPGFELGGKYCTVENVKCHDNGGTGFQVSRISAQQEYFEDWPSNNIVRHCEVWNNMDSTKINADGFGCKLTVGNNNVFDNCISHHNVDDGWDLYTKLASGAIGETALVNCASYKMGYKLEADGSESSYGNGGHNGFKMGGENIYDFHYIKDSLSFMNEKTGSGVSSNSNPALKIRNTVFYNNEGRGISLYSDKPAEYCYDIKGAISFKNSGTDRIGGSLNQDLNYTNHAKTDPLSAEANNFLAVSSSESINPATGVALDPSAVFVSTDYNAATVNGRFEQNADGSYNFKGFLQRKEAYVHDEEDAVEMYGCFYSDASNETTTSEETTQATTKSSNSNSSSNSSSTSSSGGGGGGSSSKKSSTSKSTATSSSSTEKQVGTPSSRTPSDSKPTTTSESNSDNQQKSSTTSGSNSDNQQKSSSSTVKNNTEFRDVSERPWAVEAISALSEAGVINGTGEGKFNPDAPAKRCDFVIMLTNLLGIEGTATSNFSDVPEGAYYANAVGLAKDLGIANGTGDNAFNPLSSISRQDIMVLIGRALEKQGTTLDKDTDVLTKFKDAAYISDYAKPYVAALVNLGAVSGTGYNLDAKLDITRAQMAVLLYNVSKVTSSKTSDETAKEE